MLKKIRLTNFKSFVDEEIELAPLTLLVGANASGKSNLLDAIRFLHGLGLGLKLAETLNGEERSAPDAWPGIRGRAPETVRFGETAFTLESTWRVQTSISIASKSTTELMHSISCRIEPSPTVQAEKLDQEGVRSILYDATNGLRFKQNNSTSTAGGEISTAEKSFVQTLAALNGVLSQLIPPFIVPIALPQAYSNSNLNQATVLFHALRQIHYVDIQPSNMRNYGRRGARLGSDGKNISGVLAQSCDTPVEKSSLIDWLAELCSPEIEDIDFIENKELGDVMAMLVEKGGKRISVRSLSEGTLRFLGLLIALRTAEPGSVILLEEIESGLHPTRIRLLVEYLEAATRERNLQIIATTHSPVVLQWLSDEALRNTVVFGRVPEHEGTLMRRLGDLTHFNEVVQRKGIEELFTTGWLEMAL